MLAVPYLCFGEGGQEESCLKEAEVWFMSGLSVSHVYPTINILRNLYLDRKTHINAEISPARWKPRASTSIQYTEVAADEETCCDFPFLFLLSAYIQHPPAAYDEIMKLSLLIPKRAMLSLPQSCHVPP